ncbi:MAG: 16S rRNA (cytosine(1402)-N(4))-methyltransferase RsmH [Acidimicrobiales bacterium]
MADQARSHSSGSGAEADFHHVPVMLAEVVDVFDSVPAGTYLDGTLGGAGHAVAVLTAHDHLTLLGIDQDPVALEVAAQRLAPFGERVVLARSRFDSLATVCRELGIDALSGFLFDLGVSSPQLDVADRGFSFRHDGPLDMRMDPDAALTAADVVNTYSHGELARALKTHADERFAGRIASAILAKRPFATTTQLAAVVVDAIPAAARRTGGHPAKRTFQALRIEVNQELAVIRPALEAALDLLVPGGRGAVLTYHSGEDRIVKDVFRRRSTADVPPGLPVPATDEPEFAVLRPLARRPSDDEVTSNPRAASARLRTIERTAPRKLAA